MASIATLMLDKSCFNYFLTSPWHRKKTSSGWGRYTF